MKINWRKNMYLVWIGCFFTGASINLVMPFISLYIEELGTPKDKVDLYSGLAISITALSAAIFAPIWGNLADRKGRKVMMVRAAVGMTFTMGSLAFVPNVYWLLIMRFFNGMLSGYIPNSTALVASQVPREKSGFALGTLATGAVAGNLIGPSFGGLLAQWFGMKNVFIITGAILFITAMITIFFVKEDFQPVAKTEALSTKEIFKRVKNREQLIGLFITTLILQVGVTSISPILTLYIRTLGEKSSNIIFISGLIVSISGVSAFISSPILGRLGDKIGNQKVLLAGLAFSLICIIPMAFVETPFQLGLLRFFLGFSTGALMPSINTLISKFTPPEGVSRIFSFNQTFNNFGQVIGPLVGSLVASQFDYSAVFLATACFIFCNIILCLYNFRGMLREKI